MSAAGSTSAALPLANGIEHLKRPASITLEDEPGAKRAKQDASGCTTSQEDAAFGKVFNKAMQAILALKAQEQEVKTNAARWSKEEAEGKETTRAKVRAKSIRAQGAFDSAIAEFVELLRTSLQPTSAPSVDSTTALPAAIDEQSIVQSDAFQSAVAAEVDRRLQSSFEAMEKRMQASIDQKVQEIVEARGPPVPLAKRSETPATALRGSQSGLVRAFELHQDDTKMKIQTVERAVSAMQTTVDELDKWRKDQRAKPKGGGLLDSLHKRVATPAPSSPDMSDTGDVENKLKQLASRIDDLATATGSANVASFDSRPVAYATKDEVKALRTELEELKKSSSCAKNADLVSLREAFDAAQTALKDTTLPEFVLKSDLVDYAHKSDLPIYVKAKNKDSLMKTKRDSLVMESHLKKTLESYVKSADMISSSVRADTLSDFVKTNQLTAYVKVEAIQGLAKKEDVKEDLKKYMKKRDEADYAKKTDIPSLDDCVKTSALTGFLKEDTLQQRLENFVLMDALTDRLANLATKEEAKSYAKSAIDTTEVQRLEGLITTAKSECDSKAAAADAKADIAQGRADAAYDKALTSQKAAGVLRAEVSRAELLCRNVTEQNVKLIPVADQLRDMSSALYESKGTLPRPGSASAQPHGHYLQRSHPPSQMVYQQIQYDGYSSPPGHMMPLPAHVVSTPPVSVAALSQVPARTSPQMHTGTFAPNASQPPSVLASPLSTGIHGSHVRSVSNHGTPNGPSRSNGPRPAMTNGHAAAGTDAHAAPSPSRAELALPEVGAGRPTSAGDQSTRRASAGVVAGVPMSRTSSGGSAKSGMQAANGVPVVRRGSTNGVM